MLHYHVALKSTQMIVFVTCPLHAFCAVILPNFYSVTLAKMTCSNSAIEVLKVFVGIVRQTSSYTACGSQQPFGPDRVLFLVIENRETRVSITP